MRHLAFLSVLIAISLTEAAAADTINVPGDAATIQAGIDLSVNGDEVVIADGTYTGAGNVNLSFNGKLITVRSASGDPSLCVIDCEGSSLGFVFFNGEGNSAIVDGLTITDGNGFFGGGGAMGFTANSDPTINNCVFDDNNVSAIGGAVDILGSSPRFMNCTFRNNTSGDNGGAVNISGGSPSFSDCAFVNNFAERDGGAVYSQDGGSPSYTNCTFVANTAGAVGATGSEAGGGMYNDNTSPTVTNCTFSGNSSIRGGGMLNYNSSNPAVVNCTFSGNTASGFGGGMYNDVNSNPTVVNCMFTGNVGGNEAGGGGGGMHNRNSSSPNVTNCTFSGNIASGFLGRGGGMRSYTGCNPTVTNCTFTENFAGSVGGAMYIENVSSPTVINCILWGNIPDEFSFDRSTLVIGFTDVQGGLPAEAIDIGGNINADPLFVDPIGADLRLLAVSPCIDVGDNASIPADNTDLDGDLNMFEPTPFDLDGNPRVRDGNLDGAATVDMGAYELDRAAIGIVLNLTQSTLHGTFADALSAATDGDRLLASVGAFLTEPSINFLDRAITLSSTGDISQSAGGIYRIASGSLLKTPLGNSITIGGELRANASATVDVLTGSLTIEPDGQLVCRSGSFMEVTAPTVQLDGFTRIFDLATLGFTGSTTQNGDLTVFPTGTLTANASFANTGSMLLLNAAMFGDTISTSGTMDVSSSTVYGISLTVDAGGRLNMSGDIFADIANDQDVYCLGDTLVVGDYLNNGTTIVQVGTLTIVGTLTNNGTIIGDVVGGVASGSGPSPGDGLDIAGDFIAGPASSLSMPDPVWRLRVLGDYDVAVIDHLNYHMAEAELNLTGAAQLEVMSLDIGPDPAGLDRTFSGHFPIGTLRIGGTAFVNMVDAHDNDGQGQKLCEAIYVEQLIIEAGATLNTLGCRVYYADAVFDGNVDDPAFLIQIQKPPACPDLSGDGFVNAADLAILLGAWGPCVGCAADLTGDDQVNAADLATLLGAWGACP